MNDTNLIAFGCGVSFIVFAGVYVYVREGFLASERRRKAESDKKTVEGGAATSAA